MTKNSNEKLENDSSLEELLGLKTCTFCGILYKSRKSNFQVCSILNDNHEVIYLHKCDNCDFKPFLMRDF